MNKIVIISQHHSMAQGFALTALRLKPDDFLTMDEHTNDAFLLSLKPEETDVYYLWTRPTPLYVPGLRILELAKQAGFRPICVVDW